MRAGDLDERRRAGIVGWKTVLKQILPGSVLCVASVSAALEPLPGASAHFTVGSSAIYRSSLPEMVVLPTGHSRIGDLSCSLPPLFCAAYRHERPVRTVTISRPIAMSKYEVTFEDYDRFALATNRTPPDDAGWGRGTRPVIHVSWSQAKAYASWLSEQTGQSYRLPSEAEWEYAARSGTRTRYSWGNRIGANRANCDGCGSRWDNDRTAPVGSFAANPFGLHDMHGNVAEWVEDCWHDDYRGAPSDGSAWTSGGDCDLRVVRGGAWFFFPRHLRSAARFSSAPASRKSLVGFRLVQDLTP